MSVQLFDHEPIPVLDEDEQLFLTEKGYRFVELLAEYPFVGLFSIGESLVAIKRDFTVQHEYDIAIQLLERAPTANISRPLTVLRSGIPNDAEYLVLENVPGVPLSELALLENRDPVVVTRFINMMHQIVDLLAVSGLRHGDLHFGNILTNDNLETFTIIDFDLSTIYARPDQRTCPVWLDIESLLTRLYESHNFFPEAVRDLIEKLTQRDSRDVRGFKSLTLFEDVSYCRELIGLVRDDLLKFTRDH